MSVPLRSSRRDATPPPGTPVHRPGCTDHQTGDRDLRSPNNAVWSASSVPSPAPMLPRARRRRRYSPTHLQTLQSLPTSLAAALPPVTGFPGLRVLRRLRPIRILRPATDLSPPGGTDCGWFPRSLLFGQRARCPALPLRLRHGYAVDLHHDLPDPTQLPFRQFPAGTATWLVAVSPAQTRRSPARIHRVRAGRR